MSENITGLTVIYTGTGKGKSTAALGAVFRALGHGFKCKVIQFIKGKMDTGELHLAQKLSPDLEIVQVGKGFTWTKDHPAEEHTAAAQEGVKMAMDDLASGKYGLIVLDEIIYALGGKLVSVEQVKELIDNKPAGTHLILTGRGAPPELVEKADLVTSMTEIRHPMKKGIPAQKGLDY